MNNYKFALFFFILAIVSCGESEQEKQKEPEEIDSAIVKQKDTVEASDQELPSGRLPRMAGSWIDDNLDNEFFGSKKVDSLVAAKPAGPEVPQDEAVADWNYDYLSSKEIRNLSVKEMIYYCLAYPCSYSQVCAGGTSDTTTFPKISGYLPFTWDGEQKSKLQSIEINRRRDSVILTLTGFIEKHPDQISLQYLELLMEMDALEAFPAIIKTASEKNLNNYAFLLEFMHKYEFYALQELECYNLLYGEDANRYENRARSTPENRKAVVDLAKLYYEEIENQY